MANIGSQDMNDAVWLKLARRINALLATPEVDGIVVTHGTDTSTLGRCTFTIAREDWLELISPAGCDEFQLAVFSSKPLRP